MTFAESNVATLAAYATGALPGRSAASEPHTLHGLLLEGFKSGNFGRLLLHAEQSYPKQLQIVFDRSSGVVQDALRTATCTAVADWRFPAYEFGVLTDLAYLAAYIRATEAAGPLSEAFVRAADQAVPTDREGERGVALTTIAAVLNGLSPAPAVRAASAYLLNWRGLDPRYAAQLFMAVVNCDKRGFPAYFEQFWSLVGDRVDLAHLEVVVPWLVTATSMPEFFNGLPRISHPLAAEATRILFGGEQPRYYIRTLPDRDANLLEVEDTAGHLQYIDDESPQRGAIHRLIGDYLVRVVNISDIRKAWDANVAMLERAVGDYRRQAHRTTGTILGRNQWAPRPEMRN